MSLHDTPSKSLLQHLPVEVLQLVMASLDEATSLPSLVLSCSTLYYAFKDAELLIVQQIIANELGPEVLPEAVATLKCAHIKNPRKSTLENIALVHLKQRTQPPPTISLFEAIKLSQFHFYVKHFTSNYVANTLALWTRLYTKTPLEGQSPATPTEIARIQRAFYRFELYRDLFEGNQSLGSFQNADAQKLFFNNFAPWENNQLACVYDYLFSVVAPVFNDFVEHDVVLGNNQIPYMENPSSYHFQHILRRGLRGLYEIDCAKAYEERLKVLYTPHPKSSHRFLYTSLREANLWDTLWPNTTMSQEQLLALIGPPFFQDPDTGPEYSWWKCQNIDGLYDNGWVYPSKNAAAFRKWGYVMWDRSRLDDVEFFNNSYRLRAKMSEDEEITSAAVRRVLWTWKRRALIHLAGGRGWWSSRDESQVVWAATGKASPLDDEQKRRKCEYCIGEVRCAPHRLVLKIPLEGDQEQAKTYNLFDYE